MKIRILGTEYKVKIMPMSSPGLKDKGHAGYFNSYAQEIVVGDLETDADWGEPGVSDKQRKSYMNKTMRHEIIHAFLFESGLWSNSGDVKAWACDEEMTDWIALQMPKILKVFKKCKCI